MSKILITGCNGMLGRQLMDTLSQAGEVVGVDVEQGNLVDLATCKSLFEKEHPDIVVNAAAFTRVDACEDPEIYPTAFAANAKIPKNLSALCAQNNALLVHVSTDYVYDGQKQHAYTESDPPAPLSAYGKTKLAGDSSIIKSGCRYLILRTAWLFGKHGHNFIEAILRQAAEKPRLRVVADQSGSPTSTVDLALAIRQAIDKNLSGLFHFTCAGRTTWYGFAQKICELSGISISIDKIDSKTLALPAARPANSTLDCSRFIRAGMEKPRTWEEALREYLQK